MQLNELLAQIDALKAEIDQLRPLKPEVEHRIMQKFRLDWNYHSNAIEGNTLTFGETKAFLMEGLTASGKPLKDHLDIKGHNELIDFLQLFIQRQERLTEAAIREMHKILLREPYETEAVTLDGRIVKKLIRLGEYKTTPNFVRTGSGQIHQYSAPEDVAPKMAELVEWHREQEQKAELHPVVQAALFHHRFLAIHPFDDGNGRLGRILMNLLVMRAGFPPAVVKLSERDPYVAALRKADVGEVNSIVEFAAECVFKSETLFLRGARGESIEDTDDVDKEIALFKQSLAHVEVTLPLTREQQADSISKSLAPLLEKIEEKLQQFDELFAAVEVTMASKAKRAQASPSISEIKGISAQNRALQSRGRRGTAISQLNAILRQSKQLIDSITVTFIWRRFTKSGLNAFDFGFTVTFKFEDLQLVVLSSNSKTPLISKRYAQLLSKEEISSIAADLAKMTLEHVRRNAASAT